MDFKQDSVVLPVESSKAAFGEVMSGLTPVPVRAEVTLF